MAIIDAFRNQFVTLGGPDTVVDLTATETLTNKTLTAPALNRAALAVTREEWTVVGAPISTTSATLVNLDPYTTNTSAWLYTGNAINSWVPNFGHSSSTSDPSSVNSWLGLYESITVCVSAYITNAAAFASTMKIDGQTVTPNWQGGLAPTSGNTSSYDVYTYTIIKTAATPTYVVYAARTRFA